MIEIQIEERFDLMGYAYFKEPRGEGRVVWECKKHPNIPHKFTLELSNSWGMPSDECLEQIKAKIKEFVNTPTRPAALSTLAKGDES